MDKHGQHLARAEFDQEDEEDGRSVGHDAWEEGDAQCSVHDRHPIDNAPRSRRRENTDSEDGQDTDIKLSDKEERRLRGAFQLAAGGGIHLGGENRRNGDDVESEEDWLPTEVPKCLQRFITIAASLGLKTTREELEEDFEKVVLSNGLVENSPENPWEGVHHGRGSVKGFTYKVFRRYYLDKIHGELLEAKIRQAWEDLHRGTGSKVILPDQPASDNDATEEASPGISSPGRRGDEQRRHHHQRQLQHHQRQHHQRQHHQHEDQDSDHGRAGEPYVARAELQKFLTREGEALTDEEVDELLRECRPDREGRIVYEGYRRMLIDPAL